jgi:hypothetical protein
MTIDKLIEAVEAGMLPAAVFHGCSGSRGHWAYDTGLGAEQRKWVFLAYNGSLDATKALHDALLPGWEWNIDAGDGAYVENRGDFGAPYTADIPGMPARAWLLAILKAKQAEERG